MDGSVGVTSPALTALVEPRFAAEVRQRPAFGGGPTTWRPYLP